ncbi:hypothetical protein [Burkholderia sp. ABCPW 111]|uniref:hypothetical protein n=1 Tax=Burkholderia sp. ABCPW 111 TaxID=1820025 RepID=UPI000530EB68|nr:hypothetical protein [Burkholderia sp. ABCPW 111]KGR93962.1 hypothetical protein X946_5517 [Burkholderia sp. ABCPW 111]
MASIVKARARAVVLGIALACVAAHAAVAKAPARKSPQAPSVVWDKEPTSFLGLELGKPLPSDLPVCPNDTVQRALTKTTCVMTYENTVKLWRGPDLGIPESISALMYDSKVASVTLDANEQDFSTIKNLLVTRYGPPMKTSMSVVKAIAGGEFTSEESDWSGANVEITLYQRQGQIDQSEVFVQYRPLMKAFLDDRNAKQSAAASKL